MQIKKATFIFMQYYLRVIGITRTCEWLVKHKGGVILKSKYSIIKFIFLITTIILAICMFIGKVEVRKLMPYMLINGLIYQIFSSKENKIPVQYAKYDGIKNFLFCILYFYIVIMVMAIFRP